MARKKKVEAHSQSDIEAALEELKQHYEQLITDVILVECDCGWSGQIGEMQDTDGQMVCPGCGNGLIFLTQEMEMAKAKPAVKSIGDKLVKANEQYTVNMYDNGFMFEISGRDSDNEWKTAKIMVTSVDELVALVREAAEMERDS
jgi:hypothetical protein